MLSRRSARDAWIAGSTPKSSATATETDHREEQHATVELHLFHARQLAFRERRQQTEPADGRD